MNDGPEFTKAVLRGGDGKFVAFWQRSTGRPWVAVMREDCPSMRKFFDTESEGRIEAADIREKTLNEEDPHAF
tara:strand:- start:267 stop:485 length:219 start_codon:yes stop_codon:yes gene_type:complete